MKIGTTQCRLLNTPVSLGKALIAMVLLAFAAQAVASAGFCGSNQCCCVASPMRTMLIGDHHSPINGCNGNSPCCSFQTDHSRSNVIPAIAAEPHQTKISRSMAVLDRTVSFDQGEISTKRRIIPFDRPPGPYLPIYHQTSALLC